MPTRNKQMKKSLYSHFIRKFSYIAIFYCKQDVLTHPLLVKKLLLMIIYECKNLIHSMDHLYFTIILELLTLPFLPVTEMTFSPWLSSDEFICNVFCPAGTVVR